MENYKEIIPPSALRKFDEMCLHNIGLYQDKKLQQQILSWAADMLKESRTDWEKLHKVTVEAVMKIKNTEKAKKGAVARDKKYAEFRNKFAEIQKERYEIALINGTKLTANGFVEWFLKNKTNIPVPYSEQNQKNKLRQLAQINNRKLKKLLLR